MLCESCPVNSILYSVHYSYASLQSYLLLTWTEVFSFTPLFAETLLHAE